MSVNNEDFHSFSHTNGLGRFRHWPIVLATAGGVAIGAVAAWLDRALWSIALWGIAGACAGVAVQCKLLANIGNWCFREMHQWSEDFFDPDRYDRDMRQANAWYEHFANGGPEPEIDQAQRVQDAAPGILLMPTFIGLAWGLLRGPFLGITIRLDGISASLGALLGLIWGPPLVVVCTSVAFTLAIPANHLPRRKRWPLLFSAPIACAAAFHLLRSLPRLPLQMRVTRDLQERGAVIGTGGPRRVADIDFRGGAFDDADVSRLGWLPDVDHLNLARTQITDACAPAIARLRRLRLLSLDGTSITDRAAPHLARITSLRWLSVADTNISPAGVEELRRRLPKCRVHGG